jgi:putative transposase
LNLRPGKKIISQLEAILADNRETYNAALQERRDAWRVQRKSVTAYDQMAELTQLRKDPRFATIAVDIQRDPIRRVDRAFQAFFRRIKAGERPGYPRFKGRGRYDSFTFAINPRGNSVQPDRIRIPNLGWVKFRAHQELTGTPKTATVKREGKKWRIRLACDIGPAPEKIAVSSGVGIDLGLKEFLTLSNGDSVPNPRFFRQNEARIARASRALSRKKRGSANRLKAKEQLRRAHQRAADCRKNFLHHVSKKLVADYDLIAHEALNVAGMAQSNLGKSINDAGWGELIWQLTYKAEYAGKWIVPVNPRNTTQNCSACGEKVPKGLGDRWHSCACGCELDRDHNAALNILGLGRSLVGTSAEGSK